MGQAEDVWMSLNAKQRKELWAQSHQLKAAITLSAEDLSDGAVAHVRGAFGPRTLLKVRLATDQRAACDVAAAEFERRVPCTVVKRVGRVVLLYRPADAPADDVSTKEDL